MCEGEVDIRWIYFIGDVLSRGDVLIRGDSKRDVGLRKGKRKREKENECMFAFALCVCVFVCVVERY